MTGQVPPEPGLSSAEVSARVAAGRTNAVRRRTSRSGWDIVRGNVFTWFNLILGTLWVLILVFGSWRDGLFGLVLLANTGIGVFQELRAKRALDQLALITAPRVTAIRDGADTVVAVGAVVLDDVLRLSPGDQAVVDGVLLQSAGLEMDESALTGESLPVAKRAGDPVVSGSHVVAGSGVCRVTAVGADTWAMGIEAAGRRRARVRSEVMDGINKVLKAIGVVMVPVGALTVARNLQRTDDLAASVTNTVAALVAMVPEGLVLLSSIAFAVSAFTLARRRVLVNELTAVETLARTDALCADKTGTLTDRTAAFDRFLPLPGPDAATARTALGALAAVERTPNPTTTAIGRALPGAAGWAAVRVVPFSSARKWSAAEFRGRGAWVLGAAEVLLDATPPDRAGAHGGQARATLDTLVAEGGRVLLLASAPALGDAGGLPDGLRPAGFVVLTERLRPDAAVTVRFLLEEGVRLRVVSGDDAGTVARVAAAVGVPGAGDAVDARTLEPRDLPAAMARGTVFGRVMPEQKSQMVAALQAGGSTVAMTGDGVNDVVALKQADLGIVMGSGVPAARAVGQVVLLDDAFASVPHLMAEGRRVIANAERVANLFLTKTVWALLLAVGVAALEAPYPLLPRQLTLVGSLTIGIPAFFLALSPGGPPFRPGFLRRVLRFAIPAGLVTAIAVSATAVGARAAGLPLREARALAALVLLLVGLAVLAILEWPLAGGRLAVLAAMAALGAAAWVVPLARDFLLLALPSPGEAAVCVAVGAAAAGVIALLTAPVRRASRAADTRPPAR